MHASGPRESREGATGPTAGAPHLAQTRSPRTGPGGNTDPELDEELRLSALSGLRWRVAVGLALLHAFAGSHPHMDLVYGPQFRLPAVIAAPVTGCLQLGELLSRHGVWPFAVTLAVYGVLERWYFRRLSTHALRAWGRVVGVVLAGVVLSLNVPLALLLRGAG